MARNGGYNRLDFHDCRQVYGNFKEDQFERICEEPDIRFCPHCKNYFYVPEKGGPIKSIEGKKLVAMMDFVKNVENLPPVADSLQKILDEILDEKRRQHKRDCGQELYQHV